MMAVDFVVEEDDRTLLIEIKDPSDPGIPDAQRATVTTREIAKRSGKELIHDELVPKARHSYLYLHLMEQDAKPFLFVFLDDPSELHIDRALLAPFKDRLLARLLHEAKEPWKRKYIADCVVTDPTTWSAHFPGYPLRRLSSGPEPPTLPGPTS